MGGSWFRSGVAGLALAASVAAGPVAGAAPTRESVPIDVTVVARRISAACGFTVLMRLHGTVSVKTFVDNGGAFAREIDHYLVVHTLSANGRGLVGHTSQPIKVTMQPDGSYTVAWTGPESKFTVPGHGVVFGSVGRLLIRFSSTNELLEVVQETGQSYDDVSALCAALA